MSHFTLSMGQGGPIVDAIISVSQPRLLAMQKAGQAIPKPVAIRALVDTGASATCIDPACIAQLGLTVPTGSILVHTPSTAGAPATLRQFDISLAIPSATAGVAAYMAPVLPIVESALKAQGIDALIGRDILGEAVLHYNGGASLFTIAF